MSTVKDVLESGISIHTEPFCDRPYSVGTKGPFSIDICDLAFFSFADKGGRSLTRPSAPPISTGSWAVTHIV